MSKFNGGPDEAKAIINALRKSVDTKESKAHQSRCPSCGGLTVPMAAGGRRCANPPCDWVGLMEEFDPNEPRDNSGQWTSGGGSKGDSSPKKTGRVVEQKPNEKAARAKAAHVMVDKTIQRYAEEYNEPRMAKVVGGHSYPDSEPMDLAIRGKNGKLSHLFEMKTIVKNTNGKITMDSYSQVRKIVREQEEGGVFHTIVSDDSKVFNAKGEGKHDESKRVYYYRRGVAGSARIESLHKCNEAELKKLINTSTDKLPDAAKPTDAKLRVGKWKAFTDDKGKGFRNTETGKEFRAKK
jgi:hypothetical protein